MARWPFNDGLDFFVVGAARGARPRRGLVDVHLGRRGQHRVDGVVARGQPINEAVQRLMRIFEDLHGRDSLVITRPIGGIQPQPAWHDGRSDRDTFGFVGVPGPKNKHGLHLRIFYKLLKYTFSVLSMTI